jgi:Uncharacterized conserved protein (DUF2190)
VADYTPVYSGGAIPLTFTISGAVTGGQVLVASATGTVAASGAASAVAVGVAAHDAASGARVTVWPLANVVHEIVATGTITALDGVTSAASGTVATAAVGTAAAAGTLIGIALTTASNPNKVRFIGRG